jgi:hypothetical protein
MYQVCKQVAPVNGLAVQKLELVHLKLLVEFISYLVVFFFFYNKSINNTFCYDLSVKSIDHLAYVDVYVETYY